MCITTDLIRCVFCHVGTSRFDVLQNQTNAWVGADALDNRIWNFNLNDIFIIIIIIIIINRLRLRLLAARIRPIVVDFDDLLYTR